MTDQQLPRLGLWPACGHQGTDGGTCIRPRDHRERVDGSGPLVHRSRVHEWEEQPEAPWWADFGLDTGP